MWWTEGESVLDWDEEGTIGGESGKRIYYGSAIFVMNGFQRNVCTKIVNEWLLHVEEKVDKRRT